MFLEKNRKQLQHPKMSNLTPKSKTVSELDIILFQLTHLSTFNIISMHNLYNLKQLCFLRSSKDNIATILTFLIK